MRDVKTLDEEKWTDRCDRYFSSMADTTEQKSNNTRRELLPISSTDTSSRNRRYSTQSLFKWIKSLDVHGTSHLGNSKSKFAKSLWIVIILFAFAIFGLLTYRLLEQYWNQKSSFVMRSSAKRTQLSPSLSVTFCNLNVLKVSKLSATRFEKLRHLVQKNVQNTAKTLMMSSNMRTSVPISEMLKTTNVWAMLEKSLGQNITSFLSAIEQEFAAYEHQQSEEDLGSLYQTALNTDLNIMYEFLRLSRYDIQNYGHQKTEMLRHCWINGRTCLDSEASSFVDGKKGNCVTVKSSSNIDAFEKLSLLLDTEPYEYVGVTSPITGFTVSVHDSGINHYEDQQFLISPGQNLKLSIKRVINHDRSYKCSKDREYNQKSCLLTCLEKHVIDTCGCSISLDASLRARCRLNSPYEYFCKRSMDYLLKKDQLSCDCPQRCSQTQYKIDHSVAEWPSRFHSVHIERSLANEGLKRNYVQLREMMVKVDVDTSDATHTDYTETFSITWMDLVWKIGGLSAVMIGVSVVSVLEILWFIAKSFTLCCSVLRRKKGSDGQKADEETHSTWTNNHQKQQTEREAIRKQTERPRLPSLPIESRPSNILGPITEEASHVDNTNILTVNDDYDEIDHIYSQVWDPSASIQQQSNRGFDNNINELPNHLSRKRSNFNIKLNNKPQFDNKRNYFSRVETSAPNNHNRGRIITPHLVQTYSTQQTRLVTGTRPGIFYM